MTVLSDASLTAQRAPSLTSRSEKARQILVLAVGLQVALMLPSLVSLVLDERLLNGVSIWSKPLKFQISLIVMLGTLLWLLPLIDPVARAGRVLRSAALVAAVTATGEILYITLQAARGRASHFNAETQAEAMAYSVMGGGAALLVLSAFVFGIMLWRAPRDNAPSGLRLGGAWGLMLGAVLTLVTAFALGSGQIDGPGHWVGGIRSDEGGLLLFGWSRTGGDLRVPHFFATHIMQALPLLGFGLDRFAPATVRPSLWLGAILSVVVVALAFNQAVMGQPFL